MNHIQKFLKKLTNKEKEAMMLLLLQIGKDPFKIPSIKTLSGKKQLFRVRLGRYRIIFEKKKGSFEIIKISKRNDNTYKNL